jgi:hypothetical protein
MGYQQVPLFASDKVNFQSYKFHPVYYADWSSITLK